MFDTTVTIVGNALNAPELRRTTGTNTLVASFRVASTSRRYDRDNGRWVDGPSLRVRVTCWRRLAEGVAQSVVTGDPLVVTGRMYTRDWIGEDGQQRVSYELEAIAVGHDLSRGFAKFVRHRSAGSVSAVEDAESDARIAGEPTVSVSSPFSERLSERQSEHPADPRLDGPGSPFEPAMAGSYGGFSAASADAESPDDTAAAHAEDDALNVLREAGILGVQDVGEAEPEPVTGRAESESVTGRAESEPVTGRAESESVTGRAEPDAEPIAAQPEAGARETNPATGPADGEAVGAGTDRNRPAGRRGRSRVPVPA